MLCVDCLVHVKVKSWKWTLTDITYIIIQISSLQDLYEDELLFGNKIAKLFFLFSLLCSFFIFIFFLHHLIIKKENLKSVVLKLRVIILSRVKTYIWAGVTSVLSLLFYIKP